MKNTERDTKVLLPAIRAYMGDWVYYCTTMKLADIAKRVMVAQDIHQTTILNQLIQRALTSARTEAIASYLINQDQRFFNALVIGIYGGSPTWLELNLRENVLLDKIPDELQGTLGLLVLNGTEKLFAIDGQHRVVGIKEALERSTGLENEDVTCIFLSHKTDPDGLKRTRRLFTALNRYAKPVSKQDIIALDEDDIVAILTRRLLEDNVLPEKRISIVKTKNLPADDIQHFTSIVALYDALNFYIADQKDWTKFKKLRPPDESIEVYFLKSVEFITLLREYFPLLEGVCSNPEQRIPPAARSKKGGHLLFRPIGLSMIARTAALLQLEGQSPEETFARISKVPMELSLPPWQGLLWDSLKSTMVIKHETMATQVLYYCCGGDLKGKFNTTPEKLVERLEKLSETELPSNYLDEFLYGKPKRKTRH